MRGRMLGSLILAAMIQTYRMLIIRNRHKCRFKARKYSRGKVGTGRDERFKMNEIESVLNQVEGRGNGAKAVKR